MKRTFFTICAALLCANAFAATTLDLSSLGDADQSGEGWEYTASSNKLVVRDIELETTGEFNGTFSGARCKLTGGIYNGDVDFYDNCTLESCTFNKGAKFFSNINVKNCIFGQDSEVSSIAYNPYVYFLGCEFYGKAFWGIGFEFADDVVFREGSSIVVSGAAEVPAGYTFKINTTVQEPNLYHEDHFFKEINFEGDLTVVESKMVDCTFSGNELLIKGKYAEIDGGVIDAKTTNKGKITGGTFNKFVSNAGKIEGGTYAGKVTNEKYGTISDGTFNTADLKNPLLWLTNSGSISGGTFAVGVDNKNNISGGTFNNSVSNANTGEISDGTFNGNVTNNGNIKNGEFHGEVTNQKTITGGEFHGKVTNESMPDMQIGGQIIPGFQRLIDGGVFYGEVENDFDQEGLQSSGIITDNATAVITYILGDGNTMEERYNGILKAERPLLGADKISVPEGKKFAGWYAAANFSGAPVEKLAAGTFSGYTFYAKFVDEDENQGNPTAIGEVAEDGGTVVSETFYNVLGQRIAAPANGVTIVVQTLSNGTQRTVKMVK